MSNNPDEKIGDDYPAYPLRPASVVAESFSGVARLGPRTWKDMAYPGDKSDDLPVNPGTQEPNNKPS